jgi:hypothetical protein
MNIQSYGPPSAVSLWKFIVFPWILKPVFEEGVIFSETSQENASSLRASCRGNSSAAKLLRSVAWTYLLLLGLVNSTEACNQVMTESIVQPFPPFQHPLLHDGNAFGWTHTLDPIIAYDRQTYIDYLKAPRTGQNNNGRLLVIGSYNSDRELTSKTLYLSSSAHRLEIVVMAMSQSLASNMGPFFGATFFL